MDRFLKFSGIIFLVLIAVVIFGLSFGEIIRLTLTQSSKDYVSDAIPAAFSSSDASELVARMSPDCQLATTKATLKDVFDEIRILGKYINFTRLSGEVEVNFDDTQGLLISAPYTAIANFSNGQMQISLLLTRHNGSWEIQSFNCNIHKALK